MTGTLIPMVFESLWNWLAEIDANQWAAAAAWLTALVAVVAGIVAVVQLGEARRLRFERAAPYVVVCLEPSGAAEYVLDVVIRNLGATVATDVRVTVEPPMQRAAGGKAPEPVEFPDCIPVLVPGQEYRTFWDTGIARHDSGLPDRHDAVVQFKDSRGKNTALSFVLDWSPLWSRSVVTEYKMHDAAKALREINATLKAAKEGGGKGLAVVVRDGDARDERTRQGLAEREAQRQCSDASDGG